MSKFIWNIQQEELIDNLKKWYKNNTNEKPYFAYSGAAGTGKTSIIKEFIKEMNISISEVASAAYVGKAVLVLLRNKLHASTIHSLIYNSYADPVSVVDEYGDVHFKTKYKFILKQAIDPSIKLIVIDEAPMVNDNMCHEILSFGVPTVFIGDNNQLPPIFGKSSIMDNPDYILTIVERSQNDIILLSQMVLNDEPIPYGKYGNSVVQEMIDMDRHFLEDFDIIICAKNKTREFINNHIRKKILYIDSPIPVEGEKLICRQNDWSRKVQDFYLTNGTIGYMQGLDKSYLRKGFIMADFIPDYLDEAFENVFIDYKYLTTPVDLRASYGISRYNKFEYGYIITTHLSQGSEYNKVLFLDEGFWSYELTKKLRYTAITRARESITIIKNPRF